MSDHPELEHQAPDVFAAAVQPDPCETEPEPVKEDADEVEVVDPDVDDSPQLTEKGDDDVLAAVQEKDRSDDSSDGEPSHELAATRTHATDASVATQATDLNAEYHARPWYRKLNPLRWGGVPPVPTEKIVSREYGASFLSKLTFQWMAPLMTTGYKRPLDPMDMWTVNPDRAAEPMTRKVKEAFHRRVHNGDKHPLFFALYEAFIFEFWLGGFASLAASILQVISPFTLRYLIQFATNAWEARQGVGSPPPISHGIGLALGITVMQMCQSMGINHFIYRGMMVGGECRAVLITLIYEKSMVISGRAKAGGVRESIMPETEEQDEKSKVQEDCQEVGKGKAKSKSWFKKKEKLPEKKDGLGWANGRIVNLMSVDTYRVDQASALFHMTWTSPIACLITLAVLLVNLTYSALAGFALLVIGLPILTRAIKSLFRRRRAINKITDQRVSLMQEILQSVRFVKFFGWETAFLERLGELRSREIRSIQVLLSIRNAINAVSMSLPIFASMFSFITFHLTNHSLEPAKIFSSLALFNGLRMPLNLLPLILGQVTDAWQSLHRIQEFLLEEELEEEAIHRPDGKYGIELHNASFTWERTPTQSPEGGPNNAGSSHGPAKNGEKGAEAKGTSLASPSAGDKSLATTEREPFKLTNLNLEVGRNELIAVIGTVGSGKSSLLASLAGDMRKTNGDVVFGASRAFCPQYAWIQNTTLQKNITFGKEFDKDWYQEVIRACALQPDLDMLPHGDQTEIGERGITISGGQKQRLNIARAIYFDADIVLMDDPLSAVDAHVGRHIFDNAIMGLLGNKCRILATHQLWVLNRCDRIVWMEGGKIQATGTFDELMRDHKGFQSLMETTAAEKKDEDEDEPEGTKNKDAGDGAQDEAKAKRQKKAAALMQQEDRSTASIGWGVYLSYVRASGSVLVAPMILSVLLCSQGANIMTSLWLSWWTSNRLGLSDSTYIGVYAALGAFQAVLMFLFSVMLSIYGTRASKVMLRQAVTRVLRAPMSFFDTTPLGRITNRFSRDVDVMDNNLTDAMRMYFLTVAMITSIFALIIAFFHYFAIALVPLYCLFMLAASYYRSSAREVKRFESILRSHVFAKFSEGLSGVASIRAYGLQQRFIRELREAIDEMDGAYYLTYSNQRWLSVRLDSIGNLLVFTVGILVVTSRFSVNPAIGGLVLSYILGIVQMLQFSVRQLAEVENAMNAVERLQYYGTQLEEEAPLHTVDPRPGWPEKGEIVLDNVQMRYRDNMPLVLKGLSMHIRGGERVGIVGRTGAGKSSIMSTLFRLVEISGGSVCIDGVNIATVGLHDLRSRLAIIPQDPTLFKGTVRSNLDPFREHDDLDLWRALRQADLVPADALPDATAGNHSDPSRIHLDSIVEEDGLNFSLGQRQLMALARALVRGSQIIVCDEATSSVDMETDDKIQRTMATGFRGKTLLCIAHRLRTIVGYDRICVMDAGRIAELDSPLELWHRDGIFRSMCDRSGIRREDIEHARDEMLALDSGEAHHQQEEKAEGIESPHDS